jgi:hypothetical protein
MAKKAKKKAKRSTAKRAKARKPKKARRAAPAKARKAKRSSAKRAKPRKAKRATKPKKRTNRAVLSPRWYEKVLASPEAQRLERRGVKDSASGNAAYWRQPARQRASFVLGMFRRGGRARRAAVALARAEQRHAEGPPKRRSNPGYTDAQAVGQYRRKHWGLSGRRTVREGEAADPRAGTLVKMGELRSVTYRTTKKGDGLSDYEHEFEGRRPTLAWNGGGLVIVGGDYTVKDDGIEG